MTTNDDRTGTDAGSELLDGEVQDEHATLRIDVSPETAALAVRSTDDHSATVETWLFNHVNADLAVTVDGEPLAEWRDGRDAVD